MIELVPGIYIFFVYLTCYRPDTWLHTFPVFDMCWNPTDVRFCLHALNVRRLVLFQDCWLPAWFVQCLVEMRMIIFGREELLKHM